MPSLTEIGFAVAMLGVAAVMLIGVHHEAYGKVVHHNTKIWIWRFVLISALGMLVGLGSWAISFFG